MAFSLIKTGCTAIAIILPAEWKLASLDLLQNLPDADIMYQTHFDEISDRILLIDKTPEFPVLSA